MMRYSVQPSNQIFVKSHGYLSIDKNISKNVSGKYSLGMLAMPEKLLDHAKKSATDALKASSKRVIQKTAEATSDLIGKKIANQIRGVSTNLVDFSE